LAVEIRTIGHAIAIVVGTVEAVLRCRDAGIVATVLLRKGIEAIGIPGIDSLRGGIGLHDITVSELAIGAV
jgi:hypothetical protein